MMMVTDDGGDDDDDDALAVMVKILFPSFHSARKRPTLNAIPLWRTRIP